MFFFLPVEHIVIDFTLCVLLKIFDQDGGRGRIGGAQGIFLGQ